MRWERGEQLLKKHTGYWHVECQLQVLSENPWKTSSSLPPAAVPIPILYLSSSIPIQLRHKSLSNFSKSRLSLLFTLHNKQINQETIFIKPQDTKIKKFFFFFKTPFFRLFWVICQVDPEVGWWWWWWVKSNREGGRHAEIGCVVLKKIWNSGKLLNLRWGGWKFLRFQKIGNSGKGEVEHTPLRDTDTPHCFSSCGSKVNKKKIEGNSTKIGLVPSEQSSV